MVCSGTALALDYFIDQFRKQVIWQHPNKGIILMSLKSGGLQENHALETWNLGTI
jgi:hypothetical protein